MEYLLRAGHKILQTKPCLISYPSLILFVSRPMSGVYSVCGPLACNCGSIYSTRHLMYYSRFHRLSLALLDTAPGLAEFAPVHGVDWIVRFNPPLTLGRGILIDLVLVHVCYYLLDCFWLVPLSIRSLSLWHIHPSSYPSPILIQTFCKPNPTPQSIPPLHHISTQLSLSLLP